MRMGDRVSISFRNKKMEKWDSGKKVRVPAESVALFSHWGGMGFVQEAMAYAEELKKWAEENQNGTPLSRLEPDRAMVDFIRHLTASRVEVNYYLGRDSSDGDNGDNGHHIIDLTD